ncbi:hypothetical protein [Saccharospirillum salsuginis]|uniref:PEP-CTERM protein-sorting domain-containing protein n=1 Tax=Saccharospirillum salsuginis TaxID=418750 RepID=A0A918KQT1_9GAMM|nr:hypothetical protein [Saccharospirillum salsuginis]GGX72162.1 hypothetical protein GCM10007392_44480 [Saccharospirillum salsuginis]
MTIWMRLLFVSFLASFGGAQATLLNVQGEFTIGIADSPLPDIGVFSGSFSFTYDDAGVSDTGFTTEIGIELDSLNLSPNYGGFDTSNTYGSIQFLDGSLDHVLLSTISGDPLDDLLTVISGTDDFIISYYQSTTLNDFAIANADSFLLIDEGSGYPYSGSIWVTAPVPEPASLGLLVVMLVVLGGMRLARVPRVRGSSMVQKGFAIT